MTFLAATPTGPGNTSVDASKLSSVTRSSAGDGCTFTITPNAAAATGATAFEIPYASSGGSTAVGRVSLNIGGDSSITFNGPGSLTVGRNLTLTINALDYASETASPTPLACGDATSVDSTKLAVTRSSDGDGCAFTIDPVDTLTPAQQGSTNFFVRFSSTGADTLAAASS